MSAELDLKDHRGGAGTPLLPKRRARRLGVFVLFLALLALTAPLLAGEHAARRVGMVLLIAGIIEAYDGFRRTSDALQRAAWQSGFVSMVMGGLVLGADDIRAAAMVVLLGCIFVLDAVRYLIIGLRHRRSYGPAPWYSPVIGNAAVAALVFLLRGEALVVVVAIAATLRTLGSGWTMLFADVRTTAYAGDAAIDDLQLQDRPEAVALAGAVAREEATRSAHDREFILGFVVTLFAIHLGRMGLDRTVFGILSPLVAVIGDLFIALVVAFVMIIPLRLFLRRISRGLERRGWERLKTEPASRAGRWVNGIVLWWLRGRLRLAIRMKRVRYQPLLALRRGLRLGVPIAAMIAATFPVWGMSWFFDTENWATGIWNSYAEARTDTWREAMVRAVSAALPIGRGAQAFAVSPPDTASSGDFSFIVIGDTGEGDASQHVLRDSLIEAARQPQVRFVVLSSDVIYPTGAMKDYEAKFWLPFKGVKKPVYAIPGNHDWYDALDGFVATFFEPAAARAAIRARTESDGRISSTTDSRIEEYIAESARLGREYGVPVAGQRAPFFQFQTDSFALLAIDTGVAKKIDETQRRWLEDALEAARGKFIMAVVGHPFYAAGADQTEGNTDFAVIHEMLRRHGVAIAMAGDTHDLEYYVEHYERASKPQTMYHCVNGGGGAYLSYGTALSWPATPATPTWMYYPGKAAVYGKIESTTPLWKRPAWFWTKQLDAWPFTPEWLSGMFDSNQAPFFQSFVEVRVEPSAHRVRLLPWGVHGRLRWSDADASPDARPLGVAADALIEWVVPWPEAGSP